MSNPYKPWTIHFWLWFVRQPSNKSHRLFWAVEGIDGPVFWIYYCGLFSVVWNEITGWEWGGWNFD